MLRVYAEIGIGNGSFFSTEFEEGSLEFRVPRFVLPEKVDGYYLRLWIARRVLVLSTNEGVKIKKKDRFRFKLLVGISGTALTFAGSYLALLRDADIFPNKTFSEVLPWKERKTVKVILRNDQGKIALVTNPIHKCHLLPGGGVDENEDISRAADRECREEAGYTIRDQKMLSFINEYRARDMVHSETICLSAIVDNAVLEDGRTVDEKENGLTVEWYTPREVATLFVEQEQRLRAGEIDFYNTGFNIVRDKMFFDRAVEEGHISLAVL
jgi:8-oxo-dGTP diphosphatase